MKLQKFTVITPIIPPHGTHGIIVHDIDEDGEPRTRTNHTTSRVDPGATVELDPTAMHTKRWIKNGAIGDVVAGPERLAITAHTTAEGLNDDFTMSQLRAFTKEHAEQFDDIPVSSLKKAELIDVILERMGK